MDGTESGSSIRELRRLERKRLRAKENGNMAVEIERDGRRCRIAVEGEMVIRRIADLKPQIVGPLAECDQAEIDLRGVEEIDSAGLQLLLLAKREAEARGAELRLVNHSVAVADLLDLCELGAYLGAGVGERK
jgi:anti-anti-sigma factor